MNRLLLDSQANSPIPNPKTRQGSDNTYFDTNMIIILSVILCALICALSLNSILHRLLNCTQRFNSNGDVDSLEETERNENSGIKKRVLKNIRVESYGLGIDIKESECLICLGEFVEGEKIRVLPKCRHGFHVRCIDTWLLCRSSCPTCRQSLCVESSPPAEVVAVVTGGLRRDADVAIVF